MGQYTFTWNHPAQEVYVTGDFDNWSKSVKLDKHGDSFRKTITLPGEESRIHYKFVVDGNWTTDSTAKQETDASGNVNNVVEARELSPEPEDRPANAFISSAHPQSTTAALAGQVPLEKERNVPSEQNETSLPQETPGFEDLPGQFPITPMADLNQFTVNPIPATAGIGNPIKLPAGEPVPHPSTITSNTVQSTVRDGSQYGVSDTGAPVLPPVLDSQSEAEANGASMFNLPPIGGTMIPESSLPMGAGNDRLPNFENAFTSSVAPQSTTAQLAGQVPLEPRGARGVPEVVSESQEAAHVSPEAAANPEAVREKAAVESELKQTVPAANENENAFVDRSPVADAASSVSQTASNTAQAVSDSHVPEAVAGGLAAAGATAIGAALLAKDKLSEAYQNATEPTPASKEVPDVVTESQERAHAEPEASASPEIVREKAAFEDELKHSVPEAPATSESGLLGTGEGGLAAKIAAGTAAVGTAAAGLAYAARDKAIDAHENAGAPLSNLTKEPTIDGSVPEVVTESQERAHADPEASASPEVVREKTAMEGELLSEVHKAPATSESGVFGKSEQGISEKATAGAAAASAAVSTQANNLGLTSSTTTRGATELESGSEQVPEVVQESQEKAHVEPEASANPEAVHEKHDMESELLSQVNQAPATSESGAFGNSEQGITGKAAAGLAAGATAIGATAAGAAYAARDKAADLTGRDLNTTDKSTSLQSGSEQVPEVVHESQERAHVGPEASANAEAVHEKSDMEKELLANVHKAPATSESGVLGSSEQGVTGRAAAGLTAGAAAVGATAAGAAYAARDKASDLTGRDLSTTQRSTVLDSSSDVPEVVHESQDRAHVAPEASANAEAVHEKSDMEKELLSQVHKAPATSESGALGNSEQGLSGKAAAGIAAGTAALGASAAGAAYAARDKTVETTGRDPTSFLPPSVANAINNMNQGLPSTNTSVASPNLHSSVPEAVVDSQHQAHVAPEASAEPTAVAEKSEVERELLDRVPRATEAGQPAPTETAALSATAPVKPTGSSDMESAVLAAGGSGATGVTAVSGVPPVDAPPVSYSTTVPENNGLSGATTSAHPIYNEITSANVRSTGLNAPAESQAQIPAPGESENLAATLAAPAEPSRDVSPMTRPDSSKQTEPQVTTGTETHNVPATSGSTPTTPQRNATKRSSQFGSLRGTPKSDRTSIARSSKVDEDGKPKKKGFLAKLKEKFRG
ncbi:hypothetical protein KCU95_g6531, partial [Aureobasidium melanogenum]